MKFNCFYGKYGGIFVPQVLIPTLFKLEATFLKAKNDRLFQLEFRRLFNYFSGRATPLTLCNNIALGSNAKIYLKREDLLHGGAHKTNQVIGQALLAKYMGKKEVIAETGAGQHGVASSIVSALLNLKCRVYMGAKDMERQSPNVFRMKLMGAKVIPVFNGSATLRDACNEALRDWSNSYNYSHYMLGTVAGPYPFPFLVHEFQWLIGEELKKQILMYESCFPDSIVACVGGGSNAIGIFSSFIKNIRVSLVGVEPGGKGVNSERHGSSVSKGRFGIYFGMSSPILQSTNGQIKTSYSLSAGLDFPSVGPQHAFIHEVKRVKYISITDYEALMAFKKLSYYEGIIPALESSHAIAYVLKVIKNNPNKKQLLVVNLSGRGDKDIFNVSNFLNIKEKLET